jgi:hypothetical protein
MTTRINIAAFFIIALLVVLNCCKKPPTTVPLDFSKITVTNNECEITGAIDSAAWINDVLNLALDTQFLTFADYTGITDTLTGTIQISPICPNPSNGFFLWNVSSTRECKLKIVCIDINEEILYYNTYRLEGGPLLIAFDFSKTTSFKKNTNYRMYYGFYNAKDSVYFSGHGNFRIQ